MRYEKAAKIIEIILAILVAIPLILLLIVSNRTGLTQDDSLIVGADIANDQITVANPYGYYEVVTLE